MHIEHEVNTRYKIAATNSLLKQLLRVVAFRYGGVFLCVAAIENARNKFHAYKSGIAPRCEI